MAYQSNPSGKLIVLVILPDGIVSSVSQALFLEVAPDMGHVLDGDGVTVNALARSLQLSDQGLPGAGCDIHKLCAWIEQGQISARNLELYRAAIHVITRHNQ